MNTLAIFLLIAFIIVSFIAVYNEIKYSKVKNHNKQLRQQLQQLTEKMPNYTDLPFSQLDQYKGYVIKVTQNKQATARPMFDYTIYSNDMKITIKKDAAFGSPHQALTEAKTYIDLNN